MSRREQNEKVFNSVSYFRLLKYAKPYWVRLAVGIFFGLIVGGSLFASMMIIPKMLMIVDQDQRTAKEVAKKAQIIVTELDAKALATPGERQTVVQDILNPKDPDPKLTESMNSLRNYATRFHLPLDVKKRSVRLTWPVDYDFPIVNEDGRMSWQFFSVYVFLFICAWAIKSMATYLNRYFTRWVGARVIADMREKIYNKLLAQSMKFYGNQDVGHLISRCTNDTNAIEDSISNVVDDITRCPIEVLACLSAIFVMTMRQQNIGVFLLLIIGMPICIFPVVILARRIRKIYRKAFSNVAELVSHMHEAFTGILVIKANDMEKEEGVRFQKQNKRYFKTIIRALRMQLLMQPLMELVAVTATLIFLVFSYSRGVTITEMLVILAPAIMAYRPMKEMTKVINHLQRSMAAADRYFDIIDTDTSLVEKDNPVELKDFHDGIVFEHVDFAYDSGHPVLQNIEFKIPRGAMVAVVGETGSGKTTVANLIARFYDVTGGVVRIDGIPVQDYSISSLRENIGVVTQTPILFNDTIANNIAYGCKTAVSRDDIVNAAKQANAHDFIVSGSQHDGYDEEVGEKGFKLSGGEKQRIAIARAILKNPPILILDEATSALDTVTEKLVQDALNRVMSNRTVFAIAHRLSTIQNADMILVLDKGRIVESGSHAELIHRNGLYRKLHDTQYGLEGGATA